jgi:hypothetical protein
MEKDFQRWTARRKVELLLQLIKGEVQLGVAPVPWTGKR